MRFCRGGNVTGTSGALVETIKQLIVFLNHAVKICIHASARQEIQHVS